MAIPSSSINVNQDGLGLLPPGLAGVQVKAGIAPWGTVGTVYSFADDTLAKSTLGPGKLMEAVVSALRSGGPVLAIPLTPSVAGSFGTVTQVGTGAGTVTPTAAPDRTILAKVTTAGTLGTAEISFSVGGGVYGDPIVTSGGPWTQLVAGTLSTLSFPAGTYVLNEVYTFNINGTVTQSGAGPLPSVSAANPLDNYKGKVKITTAGALGAATFQYSLDDGTNYSGDILVPSGGVFTIPETGIVLTFASTFVKDDEYSFAVTGPGYGNSDLTTALDTLRNDPHDWEFGHSVGMPANAAASASLAAAVATKMDEMWTAKKFRAWITECPTSESDSTVQTAHVAIDNYKVAVAAGDCDYVSGVTGRVHRRNIAWPATQRLSEIKFAGHLGRVADGALTGVTKLYRDEAKTPALHDGRFITGRSHQNKNGYYITGGKTMANNTSDFSDFHNLRVVMAACRVADAAILEFLNDDIQVDDEGKIDEREAQRIESTVNAKVAAVLLPDNASSVAVTVSRDTNILSTKELKAKVTVVPKGYAEQITVDIGFSNPAIAS